MQYNSAEIRGIAFVTIEDGVVQKLVLKRNDGTLVEAPLQRTVIDTDSLAFNYIVGVHHGSDANYPRPGVPAGTTVLWIGDVTPVHAVEADIGIGWV